MSIHRIEYKRTGGWKVVRRKKSKYFSDRKFGGKEEALAAAKEFQETLPPLLAQPTYTIKTHPQLFAQVRKKSGVQGVFGLVAKRSKNSVHYYWVAQKRIHKTRYIRKFSVGKYGPLALKKAIKTRKAWDAEYNQEYV
ncbi:MAG: hypothetical protein GY845_38275 [Planctomycetes bacterium]|nr:hypothetical protein [Planctomycetota bacterium]